MKDNPPLSWKESRVTVNTYVALCWVPGCSSWGHGCLVLGVQTRWRTVGMGMGRRTWEEAANPARWLWSPGRRWPSSHISCILSSTLFVIFCIKNIYIRVFWILAELDTSSLSMKAPFYSEMVFQRILGDKHRVSPGCCRSQGLPVLPSVLNSIHATRLRGEHDCKYLFAQKREAIEKLY